MGVYNNLIVRLGDIKDIISQGPLEMLKEIVMNK